MTDKSTTRKRRSEEAALDEDDILLQEESPTKKINIVEDEEELDEDALLGNSDEEENLNDTGLTDEQSYNLDEVGIYEGWPNEQVGASEGLDVPDNGLIDYLNMTGHYHYQSFASQPSMTDPISSTPITTPKSKKLQPSHTGEEETLIVNNDITGPEEGEEEDTENYLEQTKGNTQDKEKTSESEEEKEDGDGRGGRFRLERQTVTDSLKSSRTRDIPDTLILSVVAQQEIEEFGIKTKVKRQRDRYLENIMGQLKGEPLRNVFHPSRRVCGREPLIFDGLRNYQHQQQMPGSWNDDLLHFSEQPLVPDEQLQWCAALLSPQESWSNHPPQQAKDDCKMVKLFDICYHLAKQELPLSSYPSSVDLEIRHGVELGRTYKSTVHAHTFTEFLAEDIRTDVDNAVREARYMSILIDGSTDRSTSGKELMYVKYLEDGIPRTRFFSILEVKSANADGILEAINTTFQQHNIPDWEKKLIGICADGASFNFGYQEGVVAKLAAEMSWVLGMQCIAHRLELASKDAYTDSYCSKEIDAFLTSFASFYRKSPKQVPELNDMADVLEEKILQPTKADGTRLVLDHIRRSLLALVKNYPTVVDYLTELGSEQISDITKEDAAKAHGMVEKMSSYKFVLHMALYIDLLEELSNLSLAFQQGDICLSRVMEHLGTAKYVLTEMADGRDGVKLQTIKRSCVQGTFQGVTLSGMEDSSAEFDAARNDLVQPLVTCIEQRFSSFTENNVFSALSSLDPKTWPNDLTGFDFSDRDAQILIEHFNDTLVAHGCDPDQAKSEWVRLKKFIPIYYKPTITWQALWGTLFQKQQAEFPNFLHIIEMILVLPFATEKVERGFSLMNKMNSDWRVCLKTCMLDDLMMIHLEGPPEEEYTTNSAVARWRRAGKESRRP